MDANLRNLLTKLRGTTLATLDRQRKFDVLGFDQVGVDIFIHSVKKIRTIPLDELEGAYRHLREKKSITGIEIGAKYSLLSTAYVAAILAQEDGVEVRLKPITLTVK